MIDGASVLGIIPARGGSKGVLKKNIRPLCGKPLVAWTIEAASQSKYIDRLIISTEDTAIATIAENHGCEAPFIRPEELARDDTPGIAPVLHAVSLLPNFDLVVLLQPTSPLRAACDIDRCLEQCSRTPLPSCVSVVESDKPPQWFYRIDSNMRLTPFIDNSTVYTRRQDAPAYYLLNGAIYVARTAFLLREKGFITPETGAYTMPMERSVDIDTEMDFAFAEFLLLRNGYA